MDELERIKTFGIREGECPKIFEGVDTSAGASRGRALGAVAWNAMVGIVTELEPLLKTVDDEKELSKDGKLRRKARIVRDAEVRLTEATNHLERLKKDVEEIDVPVTEVDETVMAALWPKLPEDQLEVRMLHAKALEQGDLITACAIESMPLAFPGRQTPDDLAVLKRDRQIKEAPEQAAALETAEHVHAVVAATAQSAAGWLAEVGRGLPEPEKAKEQTGDDGLRFLSPSELQEASA